MNTAEQKSQLLQALNAQVSDNLRKYRTSHILHIVLSFLTGGLWVLVWLLVGLHNSTQTRLTTNYARIVRRALMSYDSYAQAAAQTKDLDRALAFFDLV